MVFFSQSHKLPELGQPKPKKEHLHPRQGPSKQPGKALIFQNPMARRVSAGISTNPLLPANPEHPWSALVLRVLGQLAQSCHYAVYRSLCPFPSPSCSNTQHTQAPLSSLKLTHDCHQAKEIKSHTILENNRENSPCHMTLSALKGPRSLGVAPASSSSL